MSVSTTNGSCITQAAKLRTVYLLVAISLFAPILLLASDIPAQLAKTVITDDNGVTFTYRPVASSIENKSDGTIRVNFVGGDLLQEPGMPEVPAVIFTVAIPPDAEPIVSLLSRESGSIILGRFSIFTPESDKIAIQNESSILASSDYLPKRGATLGKAEIGSIGGVRIIRIPVFPVLSLRNPSQVDIAKSIEIRVNFNRSSDNFTPSVDQVRAKPNRLAKMVIINPDQAANWGRVTTSNFLEPKWPQGFLYKFEIKDENIYLLSFSDLISKGVNLPASGLPSNQIKLFGNGGFVLPQNPSTEVTVGLDECAIYIMDGGDGRFESGDWLAFYGRGAGGWTQDGQSGWHYRTNPYSTENVYWLNISPSASSNRMSVLGDDVLPDTSVSNSPARVHHEPDRFIYGQSSFIGGGLQWYAYTFDGPSQLSYPISLLHPDTSQSANVKLRLVNAYTGTSGSSSPLVEFSFNTNMIGSFFPIVYSRLETSIENFTIVGRMLRQGFNSVEFVQSRSNAKALFDWVEIKYTGKLTGVRSFESIGYNGNVKYQISNQTDPWIFDITNHNEVLLNRSQEFTISQESSKARRFFLTSRSAFSRVISEFIEYFPPESDISDLWSSANDVDMLIITPDGYWDVSEQMIDHYSKLDPPLRAARVRLSEIYNRFAGGLDDPTAIRNMLMYSIDKPWAGTPNYVIFCGDGDYNYRNIDRPELENFLPPYESESTAYCTDDWFVDFNTDGISSIIPEIPNGRFTASNIYELQAMIDKIVSYTEDPEFGSWRNNMTLVADDEWGASSSPERSHVIVQEEIWRDYLPPSSEITKIYLTEYERGVGREKLQAADDLIETINRGTVLVSYMGHGNPTLWAHEHVFTQSRDLPRIERSRRLPLYVAFTCDWGYWDNPQTQCFPEQLFALTGRGAIGTIASTRLTYSNSNSALAREFYTNLFDDSLVTIGEALAISKHRAVFGLGPTYHLLGDPSVYLANPRMSGEFTMPEPYPLTPLAMSTLQGRVLDADGSTVSDFSGELEFQIEDTGVNRVYIVKWYDREGNLHQDPLPYYLPGSSIYRGLYSIENGAFDGNFVLPIDVTLGSSLGRIVGYWHDEKTDGAFVIDSVAFANHAAVAIDTLPPEIDVFFNHRGYRSGDKIGQEPLLIVDLTDNSGINLTGKMGHGISISIDGGRPISLTNEFKYNLDSNTSGSLEKQIGPISSGFHTAEIVVWDSFNNFAVMEIDLEVVGEGDGLRVERVLNWPNPFNTTTQLTFEVNRPVEYEIHIYTVGGRSIWSTNGSLNRPGMVTDVEWDGRDYSGDSVGNGVYLYKVTAYDEDGEKSEGLGRIAFVK